jgi:hypothetical protein
MKCSEFSQVYIIFANIVRYGYVKKKALVPFSIYCYVTILVTHFSWFYENSRKIGLKMYVLAQV